MTVADLHKGGTDSSENVIRRFHVRRPPDYAVYFSDERVVVTFADDPALADKQRRDLAQIAPTRGEINGLIDDWRNAQEPGDGVWLKEWRKRRAAKLQALAERFDQRIADALVVALNGDVTGAGAVLDGIKADVVAHRSGIARIQALVAAAGGVLAFILLAAAFGNVMTPDSCDSATTAICFPYGTELWRGALTGAFGALFSLAMGIRTRQERLDFNFWSNITEAVLRIAIGAIAGTVLVALVRSGFVHIGFGGDTHMAADSLYYAIAGFAAGFTERLVPDLLGKAQTLQGAAPPPLHQPSRPAAAKDQAPGHAGSAAAPPPGGAGAATDAAVDHAPEQSDEDGCVCDHELADDDVTDDAFLPAASGGVATSDGEVR